MATAGVAAVVPGTSKKGTAMAKPTAAALIQCFLPIANLLLCRWLSR